MAQIAGILFGLGGIYLIIIDAKATGRINLKTNFITGEIESGSAGLFLLFFSTILIIQPLRTTKSNESKSGLNQNINYSLIARLTFVAVILIAILIITYLSAPDKIPSVLYGFALLAWLFFTWGGLFIRHRD